MPGELLCDYTKYALSLREWARYILEGAAACALTAYVFYRSKTVFLLFLPAALIRPVLMKRKLLRFRQEELRREFKEAILILASALSAGYSIENAFSVSQRDLEELYGRDAMITKEFSYISEQIKMNRTVEELFASFAARSGLEEIRNFSVIFGVSKRSRGELVSVVNHVTHIISDRIQVQEEIMVMTAEKQFEQKVMNIMPFFIVLYVDLSSPGFFSQMYETLAGRIIMTCCLVVYLTACLLSARILKIEV